MSNNAAEHDDHASRPDRYHRQSLLREIGAAGQQRLGASHALIVGCGALGTVSAEMLARAGVGRLTIVDRDTVEWTNLQRQLLYVEADAREGMPKAEAARRRLTQINSQIRIRAVIEDFTALNAERLAFPKDAAGESPESLGAVNLLIDGTDNFETRYLMNDLAVKRGVGFLYAAAVGTTGMMMPVISHEGGPCLRCLFEEPPAPGSDSASATCDTVGVLGPVVAAIANMQAVEAIKMLVGDVAAVGRTLTSMDLWANDIQRIDVSRTKRSDCPCCGLRRFDFLEAVAGEGGGGGGAVSLCGRNSMQIAPGAPNRAGTSNAVDLAALGSRLAAHGAFTVTRFLLRGEFRDERGDEGGAVGLTVFADGRALFAGVTQAARARALYAKYIGA